MPQKDSKTKPLTTGFKGIQDYLENPALVETNNWSWSGGGNSAQKT